MTITVSVTYPIGMSEKQAVYNVLSQQHQMYRGAAESAARSARDGVGTKREAIRTQAFADGIKHAMNVINNTEFIAESKGDK